MPRFEMIDEVGGWKDNRLWTVGATYASEIHEKNMEFSQFT